MSDPKASASNADLVDIEVVDEIEVELVEDSHDYGEIQVIDVEVIEDAQAKHGSSTDRKGRSRRTKKPKGKLVLCPYCGHAQSDSPDRCPSCGGFFEQLSLVITRQHMGPWYVRDRKNPFRPGCSFDVIRKEVAKGKIKATSILRGPTTRQYWSLAKNVPGVANLLGYCHSCGTSGIIPGSANCPKCKSKFPQPTNRDGLGLASPQQERRDHQTIRKLVAQQQAQGIDVPAIPGITAPGSDGKPGIAQSIPGGPAAASPGEPASTQSLIDQLRAGAPTSPVGAAKPPAAAPSTPPPARAGGGAGVAPPAFTPAAQQGPTASSSAPPAFSPIPSGGSATPPPFNPQPPVSAPSPAAPVAPAPPSEPPGPPVQSASIPTFTPGPPGSEIEANADDTDTMPWLRGGDSDDLATDDTIDFEEEGGSRWWIWLLIFVNLLLVGALVAVMIFKDQLGLGGPATPPNPDDQTPPANVAPQNGQPPANGGNSSTPPSGTN